MPSRRNRRLHLYECLEEHAVAAASMLAALTQLTSICLGVHSCSGSDLDSNYPNTDSDWEEVENWSELVRLPRLGALTALTELCLAGVAAPPPDFRQLRHLRRLTVVDAASGLDGDGDWWGAEGLGGLASLTRVEVLQHPGLPGEHGAAVDQSLPARGFNAAQQTRPPLQILRCWPPRPTPLRCMPPTPLTPGGRNWRPCAQM